MDMARKVEELEREKAALHLLFARLVDADRRTQLLSSEDARLVRIGRSDWIVPKEIAAEVADLRRALSDLVSQCPAAPGTELRRVADNARAVLERTK